ncbi:unnamed protein product [Amoebophrya sp. A25]|nr:unnamed protein product [Amoebophrya sp. A25]|eukprot:GSA25T00026834001.1
MLSRRSDDDESDSDSDDEQKKTLDEKATEHVTGGANAMGKTSFSGATPLVAQYERDVDLEKEKRENLKARPSKDTSSTSTPSRETTSSLTTSIAQKNDDDEEQRRAEEHAMWETEEWKEAVKKSVRIKNYVLKPGAGRAEVEYADKKWKEDYEKLHAKPEDDVKKDPKEGDLKEKLDKDETSSTTKSSSTSSKDVATTTTKDEASSSETKKDEQPENVEVKDDDSDDSGDEDQDEPCSESNNKPAGVQKPKSTINLEEDAIPRRVWLADQRRERELIEMLEKELKEGQWTKTSDEKVDIAKFLQELALDELGHDDFDIPLDATSYGGEVQVDGTGTTTVTPGTSSGTRIATSTTGGAGGGNITVGSGASGSTSSSTSCSTSKSNTKERLLPENDDTVEGSPQQSHHLLGQGAVNEEHRPVNEEQSTPSTAPGSPSPTSGDREEDEEPLLVGKKKNTIGGASTSIPTSSEEYISKMITSSCASSSSSSMKNLPANADKLRTQTGDNYSYSSEHSNGKFVPTIDDITDEMMLEAVLRNDDEEDEKRNEREEEIEQKILAACGLDKPDAAILAAKAEYERLVREKSGFGTEGEVEKVLEDADAPSPLELPFLNQGPTNLIKTCSLSPTTTSEQSGTATPIDRDGNRSGNGQNSAGEGSGAAGGNGADGAHNQGKKGRRRVRFDSFVELVSASSQDEGPPSTPPSTRNIKINPFRRILVKRQFAATPNPTTPSTPGEPGEEVVDENFADFSAMSNFSETPTSVDNSPALGKHQQYFDDPDQDDDSDSDQDEDDQDVDAAQEQDVDDDQDEDELMRQEMHALFPEIGLQDTALVNNPEVLQEAMRGDQPGGLLLNHFQSS